MMNFTDSKRPYHEVAQSLCQIIIVMNYSPGDRLSTEREIQRFSYSYS